MDHLEYKNIIGNHVEGKVRFVLVKPKKRSWIFWRPFFMFQFGKIGVWIGWKQHGQFACSIKAIDD
jgi:hypothetical protein